MMQVILSSCDIRHEGGGSNRNTHTQTRKKTGFLPHSREIQSLQELQKWEQKKNYFLITAYVNDENNLAQHNMKFIYLFIYWLALLGIEPSTLEY